MKGQKPAPEITFRFADGSPLSSPADIARVKALTAPAWGRLLASLDGKEEAA